MGAMLSQWERNVDFPKFSFIYGGAASADFLSRWSYQMDQGAILDGCQKHHIWTDPDSGLQATVHLRYFADFANVEGIAHDWFMTFENQGTADTPILEAVFPLDVTYALPEDEKLRLHYANGSTWAKDDFLPRVVELQPGQHRELACVGGYSSQGILPFMNLQYGGGGMILAIGWSGQWSSHFERAKNSLCVTAGMEHIHLRLHPGEKIRTPRILLLPWQGASVEAGQNRLRQLLLAHYLPRVDGQPVVPPIAHCLQSYFYLTGQAGETFELTAQAKGVDLGVQVHWVDALWYGGEREWWAEVGSWNINPERFPNGLRPISDSAHRAGMKFLLWFEPERARLDSCLAQEHPEYFLCSPGEPNDLLLDLGNFEAREFITNLISDRITQYGVDIYRQDFNFEAALPFWQAADVPDRVGMAEIRYVEGLYTFWDALRRRHPGLWIDNCASGGRRIDLETLSRSLPLWPSDFLEILSNGLDLMIGEQCINAGLARWMPYFGGAVFNFTPYSTRSQIIGGFNFGYHVELADFPHSEEPRIIETNDVVAKGISLIDDDFPIGQARQAIAEWHSIRPFILGDFHLLLPLSASDHDWCAWQFHCNDLGAGIAVIFRRHRSSFLSMEINLRDIDPQAEYAVSVSPGYTIEPEQQFSGLELRNLALSISEKPGSLLVRYHKVA